MAIQIKPTPKLTIEEAQLFVSQIEKNERKPANSIKIATSYDNFRNIIRMNQDVSNFLSGK